MPAQTNTDDLAAIRRKIDALDKELLGLLKQRLDLVTCASAVKTDRDQIIDPPRIEEVIGLVLAEGQKKDLPEEFVEPLWRLLIELSIAHEFKTFDEKS